MRSEQAMLAIILRIARNDARIRAVIMNGSRTNPRAPRDIFQDFDIVYVVTDVEYYRHNHEFVRLFGDIMVMQMPEDIQDPPPSNDGSFVYLMQFLDGNRVDLTLYPVSALPELEKDSLSTLLLDKDGIIEPFEPPSERDYLPQPPTAKSFSDACSEFWWVCTNVAKGLWREEVLYAKGMMEVIRVPLMKMVVWHIGLHTEFAHNPGTLGKYIPMLLDPELWEVLEKTYTGVSYERNWEALFAMCDLFRRTSMGVARHFGFDYPIEDDRNVSAHLNHVRNLPRDAAGIY